MKKIQELPFNCPICSKTIFRDCAGDEFFAPCEHVAFVYVFGEENGFMDAQPEFAARYFEQLVESGEYQEFLDEKEIVENKEAEAAFIACEFCKSKIILGIPFFEKLILKANPNLRLFEYHSTDSGMKVGIYR